LINPLIFIPSPRDIQEFIESVEYGLSKYDRFWVRYLPEAQAYNIAKKFFLEHEQYTHLVILPDDLIVTQKHIDQLVEDIKERDYEVLSGICAVDELPINKGKYAVCQNANPSLADLSIKSYDYLTTEQRDAYLKYGFPIINVRYAGFPLIFIRRDVIEKIDFRPIPYYNCCPDVQFCYDCEALGISLFVDLRVVGNHLKKRDGIYDNMFVGNTYDLRKKPVTIYKEF
jgi:hypothetical protein